MRIDERGRDPLADVVEDVLERSTLAPAGGIARLGPGLLWLVEADVQDRRPRGVWLHDDVCQTAADLHGEPFSAALDLHVATVEARQQPLRHHTGSPPRS